VKTLARYSGSGVESVNSQLDFFAVAVEGGGEKLKKAGEAEEGIKENGREANGRLPFPKFLAARESQENLRISELNDLTADYAGFSRWNIGQIDAHTSGHGVGENRIIRAGIEEATVDERPRWPDKGRRDDWSGPDPTASQSNGGSFRLEQFVMEAERHGAPYPGTSMYSWTT
jgi:hypothetical protein